MNFDELLKNHLGEFGFYQAVLVLCISYLAVPGSLGSLDYIFVGAVPDFRCDVGDVSHLQSNFSSNDLLQLISPRQIYGALTDVDSCQMYDRNYSAISVLEAREMMNDTHNIVIPCTKWIYSQEIFTSTIVTEWDLVCDREWLAATSQAVFMSGKFMMLFVGWMADRFGRRPVTLCGMVLHILGRLSATVAPNYIIFIMSRFLMSCSGMITYNMVFLIGIEMVGPRWRTFAGQTPYFMWSFSYVALSIIAYFVRDWRMLYWVELALVAPFIFYFCYLPESVRWLQTKGKYNKAQKSIEKIAKINRRTLPPKYSLVEQKSEEKPKVSLWKSVRKSNYLVKLTGILMFLWSSVNFTYYALIYYIPKLGGNIFLSTMISGALEIPALLLVQVTFDSRLGRRLCTSISFIINGVALLAIIIVPKDMNWLVIALALVGRFMTTYIYSAVYIYTPELYPTSIRAIAMSFCSTVSRFGGVLAPYIILLKKVYPYLPEIVFGVLTITAGLLTLLLRDTLGENLPETFGEMNGKTSSKHHDDANKVDQDDVKVSKSEAQSDAENGVIHNTYI